MLKGQGGNDKGLPQKELKTENNTTAQSASEWLLHIDDDAVSGVKKLHVTSRDVTPFPASLAPKRHRTISCRNNISVFTLLALTMPQSLAE